MSFGQTRGEVVSTINFCLDNCPSSKVGHEFVDEKLDPALKVLENIVCTENDTALFDLLVDLIKKTSGSSAHEMSDWVLGNIFICQTDLVVERFPMSYYDHLEWGFQNVTYEKTGFEELEKTLKKLKKHQLRK
ncbi:MAG: hypothetical protein ACPG5W_09645 [Flavobacteriales bacterium]